VAAVLEKKFYSIRSLPSLTVPYVSATSASVGRNSFPPLARLHSQRKEFAVQFAIQLAVGPWPTLHRPLSRGAPPSQHHTLDALHSTGTSQASPCSSHCLLEVDEALPMPSTSSTLGMCSLNCLQDEVNYKSRFLHHLLQHAKLMWSFR
jgi:hypothetical protein